MLGPRVASLQGLPFSSRGRRLPRGVGAVRKPARLVRLAGTSPSRLFVFSACLLAAILVAASCGSDEAAENGDSPGTAEVSKVEGGPEDGTDSQADSGDHDESKSDPGDAESDDDGLATRMDSATPTPEQPSATPVVENPAFTRAYEVASGAFLEYSSLRHEGYLRTILEVDSLIESASLRRAESLAAAEAYLSDHESTANAASRATHELYQSERDAATQTNRDHRTSVEEILASALEQAELDSEEAYTLWEITGEDAGLEAGLTCFQCHVRIGNIVGYIAWRLAFDHTYLRVLQSEIDALADSPPRTALVAARDSALSVIAENPLPYETPTAALDGAIGSALEVSRNQSAIIRNIEDRVDAARRYSVNHGDDGAEEAAYQALQEILSTTKAAIDDAESAELSALEQSRRDASTAYSNMLSQAEDEYRRAVIEIGDAVDAERAAFDFDKWLEAAFVLADSYMTLYDVAEFVADELRGEVDLDDPASILMHEFASSAQMSLVGAADAAGLLRVNYSRRTVLDLEAEFADSVETLFFEVEGFEGALISARMRAQAFAGATSES